MGKINSLAKLLGFINCSKADPKTENILCIYSKEFISTKFTPQLPLICKRHCMDVWFGWVSETCFVKDVNASLSRGILWLRPQDSLHTVGNKIINQPQKSHRRHQTEACRLN